MLVRKFLFSRYVAAFFSAIALFYISILTVNILPKEESNENNLKFLKKDCNLETIHILVQMIVLMYCKKVLKGRKGTKVTPFSMIEDKLREDQIIADQICYLNLSKLYVTLSVLSRLRL